MTGHKPFKDLTENWNADRIKTLAAKIKTIEKELGRLERQPKMTGGR